MARRSQPSAQSSACCSREMLEAKVAMMMRPAALSKMCDSASPTVRSLGVMPSDSLLVLSLSSSSTPSSPSRASRARSGGSPLIGVWSILKSPLWTTTPSGVRMASAHASGMEWVARMNSTDIAPICTTSPWRTVCRSVDSRRRCSRSLLRRMPRVSEVP